MAKKETTTDKAVPRISVLERRLQNPFGEPSGEIVFKEKNITARWFNDGVRNGRVYQARKDLGWLPVTPDMIADMDSIGAHDLSAENKITRGERGQELLMWMPTHEFKQIQMAKTRVNLEKARDLRGEQKEILERMGQQLGDEAASVSERHVKRHMTINDTYEVMQRTPDAE